MKNAESKDVPVYPEPNEAMPILDHLVDMHCKSRTEVSWRLLWLSRILGFMFILGVLGLFFLPWQQFVRGQGKVIAFDPLERSVVVEAPLSGRVDKAFVVEGQKVEKGQLMFELVDNDPNLLANLTIQVELAEAEKDAAKSRLERLQGQLSRKEAAVPQAIEIESKQLEAAMFSQRAADQQHDRVKALYEDRRGLVSKREYELAVMQRDSMKAATLKAEASLLKERLDQEAELEGARASVESARSSMNKADREVNAISVRIAQLGHQKINAPRSGIVFRVQANEGAFLKTGTPLCTVIPNSDNLVVQLWVDGNDMPLIRGRETDEEGNTVHPGSPVRLQFEGWPAIQFVGWPSIARGTFGGEVIFVDAADNGFGMFRLLVAPDPDVVKNALGETETIDWPGAPIMRQGINAQGWVLLEQVPMWYEAWRQLNGFPPALKQEKSPASGPAKK